MVRSEEGSLIELFKKQRPGEPPSIDAARSLLNQLFFDPKRYDLTRVGRYKLNSRLGLDIDLETRTLTNEDIIALVKELVSLPKRLGMPEEPDEEIKDFAAEALSYPREPVQDHLDEYEHFGNRRLRTVGELIQEAFRIGLYRMERVVRERLTTEDADTITPHTVLHLDATQEEEQLIAQANTPIDAQNRIEGDEVLCRTQAGQYVTVPPTEVDLIDVSPEQIWSVATAMIPFLEHDDANRALMGSNMQRQAVPLLKADAPLIGTGMERRAALDTGDVMLATRAGSVDFVDANEIVLQGSDGKKQEYQLQKYMRSNQGTPLHHKPIA